MVSRGGNHCVPTGRVIKYPRKCALFPPRGVPPPGGQFRGPGGPAQKGGPGGLHTKKGGFGQIVYTLIWENGQNGLFPGKTPKTPKIGNFRVFPAPVRSPGGAEFPPPRGENSRPPGAPGGRAPRGPPPGGSRRGSLGDPRFWSIFRSRCTFRPPPPPGSGSRARSAALESYLGLSAAL